jgi:hypothetical protein
MALWFGLRLLGRVPSAEGDHLGDGGEEDEVGNLGSV